MADPSMPHTPGPPGQQYTTPLSCPDNKLMPVIGQYSKHTGAAALQNMSHLQAFLCLVDLRAVELIKACLSNCKFVLSSQQAGDQLKGYHPQVQHELLGVTL